MGISTYSDLVTAVTEWLARDQDATLIARIPSFITLCEAKLNRGLHHMKMEKRSYATFNIATTEPEFVSLPSDFQSMRRIRLSSATNKPHLDYKSQVQLDELRRNNNNAAGTPRYFTIFGSEIEFAPTPSSNETIEMVYRANLPALSADNSTNWLITLAPDIYLYGTLLESAAYMQQDERVSLWTAGFAQALDALNRSSITMQFNAQPLVASSSGATP